MQKTTLGLVNVSGEEIYAITKQLEPIIMQFHPAHAYIACLSLAAVLQQPTAPIEVIHACVRKASETISLFLAGYAPGEVKLVAQ